VLYYQTTVPAASRVAVHVSPNASSPGIDPVVRILPACGSTICLASADATASGGEETAIYKNTGASAVPVIVAVGSYSTSSDGAFDLDTTIKPSATNITCAAALAVTSGSSHPAEDGDSAIAGLDAVCLPGAIGPVLFYKITIPTGKSLKADVNPIGSWDPVIRLLSSCGASTCLASQDAGASGTAESLTYANTSGAPLAVVIAVGGYSSLTAAFDLTVSTL
jgi:hypothetical protein